MEMSRRFRGSARRIEAALSEEVKDQIRQKVHELLGSGDSAGAEDAEGLGAPGASDDVGSPVGLSEPAGLSEAPADGEQGGEATGSEEPPVDDSDQVASDENQGKDDGFDLSSFGNFDFSTDVGDNSDGQEPAPQPQEQAPASQPEAASASQPQEQPATPQPQETGAVDLSQGNESMSNADENAQVDLSPTREESFDDDGSEGAFNTGEDFSFDDFSLGGDDADDDANAIPELTPPKSRRQSLPQSLTKPEATAADFSAETSKEPSEPKVKNPGKNTKVPTLHEAPSESGGEMKLSSVSRRGRFDKLTMYAARGVQRKRKNKDTMPDKDTNFTPRRDPPIRAPKKVTRDTVQNSRNADKDIGKDPDIRKD